MNRLKMCENMKDEPPKWKLVYENIEKMRHERDAPVDTMGAEHCFDKGECPKISRFQALIGLMLSSQTKDSVTHGAMKKLRNYGLNVEKILNTSTQEIEQLIYPIGFYKRKASYIKRTSQILRDLYDDDIPSTVEQLCSLPGVGPKIAYICMDIAWGKVEGIGVDTHVHRICNRLSWTRKETKTPEHTRKALEEWLPREYWNEVNLLLVGFGQQICLPINPKCAECLNQNICPFGIKYLKGYQSKPKKGN